MAVDDQTEEALGYAAEGAKYAQEYTPKDITLKDAATFVAEATPIIGDAMAAKQVYDELQKDEPNYLLAGALGGAAIIGLVPGLGDAAAAAIRKGAKTALDTAKRVEIDPDTLGMMGGNVRIKPKEAANISSEPTIISFTKKKEDKELEEFRSDMMSSISNAAAKRAELVQELQEANIYGNYQVGARVQSKNHKGESLPPFKVTGLGLKKVDLEKQAQKDTLKRVEDRLGIKFEYIEKDGEYFVPMLNIEQANGGKSQVYLDALKQRDVPIMGQPKAVVKQDVPTVEAAGLTEDSIEAWRKENATSEEFRKALKGRNPELQEMATKVKEGTLPVEEYRKRADEIRPIRTVEQVPEPATYKEVVSALNSKQRQNPVIGLNASIPEKDMVEVRLNIPAYTDYDVWIPTIRHNKKEKYKPAVRIQNVSFIQPESSGARKALRIAQGGEKNPFAVMTGEYVDGSDDELFNLAQEVFDSSEWTQVGYDPIKRGFFYDRSTGEAILQADEVIQVGHLVLAKNATKTSAEAFEFNEGGLAMDDQMEMVFKSSRGYALGGAVEEVDPVSGNEVPTGSLPEEVRDDIPARLSEGEYVVPADVVRYYGVKFFEDLRSQAKMGFDTMEANGRIGGEPMGMEIVEPEDMQFDISELEVVDDGVMGFDEGGFVDDGGALGLGSEGIGLSNEVTTGIETRAYTNDAGDIIYIMFIGNTPMMAIPDGYYPLEEAKKEEPKEEPKPQARDRGPSTPVVAPEPIDYKSLTLQELTDMVDDQQSVTGDVAAGIFGIVNPLLGVAVKAAMWHQAQQIENEIKRRTTMEGVTEEDLAAYTNLLEIMEKDKPSLIERIFGEKDKPVVDPDAVDAAVKEAMEEPEYSAEGWVDPDTRVTQDFPPIPRETGPNAAEAAEIAAANKSAAEAYEAAGTQPFLPFEADATAPTTDYSDPKLSNEIQDTMGITSAVFPAQPRTPTSRDDTKSPSETMTMPKSEEPVVIPEPVDPDAFRKRKQKTGVGGRNIGGR